MTSRLIINAIKHGLLWGLIAAFAGSAMAASGHDDKAAGSHGEKSMDHQEMTGEFKQEMTVAGVKAEFQIMNLESMNRKDPDGATHHVMVKFMDADNGEHLQGAVGRIKVISPSKKETEVDLKDFSGTLAANFTFDESGRYGIICLAKVGGKKPLYKFWYPHE